MINNNKILMHKIFPHLPSNRYNNLRIDQESLSYITTPHNSNIISSIIDSHIPKNITRKSITLFDGTACVGGDTISLGSNFGTVIACEINENRYKMLINNLSEYKLYNVIPINDNTLNIYSKINFIDIMYFDPPWGGKDYKKQKSLTLSIGNKTINEIIKDIFEKKIRSDVKMVVLKLPKNYNLKKLYKDTNYDDVTMMLYELKKMLIIIYKKNSYV